MMIRIKSPFLMFLFGWGHFPSYVEAHHGLWLAWLRSGKWRQRL